MCSLRRIIFLALFCLLPYLSENSKVFAQEHIRINNNIRSLSQCLGLGDVDNLSEYFADNMEVSIFSMCHDSSKRQTRQIFKSFFDQYTARNFELVHITGKNNNKYIFGYLKAGGSVFPITLFICLKNSRWQIEQIKIGHCLN